MMEASMDETETAKVVISLIICVLGLIGNFLAIFVILVLKEYQKSVTHLYVLQLALADSLFLLTLPFKASEDLNNQWIYPEWMCKAKETILFLNYYASILFLMIMSFDRYVAVCHTFSDKLQIIRRRVSAFIITVLTWTLSLLLCIPVMLNSVKLGAVPHCKCSYEFPSYDSRTAACIQDGWETPEETMECLGFYDLEVENGELYCTRYVVGSGSSGSDNQSNANDDVQKELEVFNSTISSSDFSLTTLNPRIGVTPTGDTVHGACHYWDRSAGWTSFLAFNFAVMFLLPVIVMVACYGLIVRRLSTTRRRLTSESSTTSFTQSSHKSSQSKRKRKPSSRSDKDRRRVTIMCATLVSSFIVCWLPFHAIHLAKVAGIRNTEPDVCKQLLIAGSIFGYLNAVLNPYLYSFLGTNFTRRWRLLRKSRGIRQFVSIAAWKRDDSSSSNRQYQSKKGRNRNLSNRSCHPYTTYNIPSSLATMSTKVSMSKAGDNSAPPPTPSGNQFVEENLPHPPSLEQQNLLTKSEIEMEAAATPEQ